MSTSRTTDCSISAKTLHPKNPTKLTPVNHSPTSVPLDLLILTCLTVGQDAAFLNLVPKPEALSPEAYTSHPHAVRSFRLGDDSLSNKHGRLYEP